jgi:heat shock protein HtpX
MSSRLTFQDMIARNKRNSVVLMLMMIALLLLIGAVFGAAFDAPETGLAIALIVGAVWLLIAWNAGASTLMAFSGAKEIEKKDYPQLFNVVEELAIAAGLPMPRVFVIETDAPNAFATGSDPKNAAVAITTGLLNKLNRDELQGVMAHEIGHIRNFDIRYTMLMAMLAGAIVMLSEVFLRMLWYGGATGSNRNRRRNQREGGNNAQIIFLLIGVALAVLAPLLTTLIRLALSRQREYLADASAVEFTRNPAGLSRALAKISSDTAPMESSKVTAPLYIVNPTLGLRGGGRSLFSTHPPTQERIARLQGLQDISQANP